MNINTKDYAYGTLVIINNIIALINSTGLVIDGGAKLPEDTRPAFSDLYTARDNMLEILAKEYNIANTNDNNNPIYTKFKEIILESLDKHRDYNIIPNSINTRIMMLIEKP